MSHSSLDSRAPSFLAGYRPPRPRFQPARSLPAVLGDVWALLRADTPRAVIDTGHVLLREPDLDDETRAALQAGLAYAYVTMGNAGRARQFAQASLDAFPAQWMARRVLLDVLFAEYAHAEAFAYARELDGPAETAAWDEPLAPRDRHLAVAASAWQINEWETVAEHLLAAFGDLPTMPPTLQEDWFRLSFYREAPDDAARAAGLLIAQHPTETADVLLQTMVRQGWNRQALDLYRTLYAREPGSELLRRRLVGLCIREGDVTTARKLMEQGALKLSVA